jgi:hypothetical protein
MGDLSDSVSNFTTWLDSTSIDGSNPNYYYAFGGAAVTVLGMMLLSPGGAEYKKKRAALRSQYRGYRRVSKAAGSTLSSV